MAVAVQPTKEPMHWVVDSTGLKVYGEGEWKVRKHGWTTRRTWRELHLGINADTQEIVAHQLTLAYADDARQLKLLLRQIDTPIASCYADGAYDRWHVHRLWPIHRPNSPRPSKRSFHPVIMRNVRKVNGDIPISKRAISA